MATGAGLAESKQTHRKEKVKVCLDIDRPSHGRSYEAAVMYKPGPRHQDLFFVRRVLSFLSIELERQFRSTAVLALSLRSLG